ncbi:MAG: DsrE family protein [Hyphomicrobiales bacterium]|nr:DsrE family protein [Hyphomicrobiales bacterium]
MNRLRIAAIAAALMAASAGHAEEAKHRIAIQVDQNDPAVMNLALNNAANVRKYYAAKGETVAIEIVAYGPGLAMFVADHSPVEDRISAMSLEYPEITFSACGNTHAALNKKAGHEVPLLDEAKEVPSGVVRLMELQDEGYAYVKP